MNIKEVRKIWERHQNEKCDCSDGDNYNIESLCYISIGYLEAIEKAKILERELDRLSESVCEEDQESIFMILQQWKKIK